MRARNDAALQGALGKGHADVVQLLIQHIARDAAGPATAHASVQAWLEAAPVEVRYSSSNATGMDERNCRESNATAGRHDTAFAQFIHAYVYALLPYVSLPLTAPGPGPRTGQA